MRITAASFLSLSVMMVRLDAQDATVTPLMAKDLASLRGKEITMIAVEYAPGGVDPVHTHHAQALVYVLDGSIVMQVKGGEPVKDKGAPILVPVK